MKKLNKTKKFSYITMLSALAILLNVIEGMFIPPVIFGIRIGIANIIALITIELFDIKSMIIVNVNRVLIGSILRGMIFGSTFWVSASGVILSTIVLSILSSIKSSIPFKSIMSAIAHSTGQVLAIMILYQNINMISILSILLITSIITGFLTSYVSILVLKRIKV